MKKKIVSILILLSCCVVPYTNPKDPSKTSTPDEFDNIFYNWSRTWAQVAQYVKKKHFSPAHVEESMIKAIDAFMSHLDPHSNFLDPDTYKAMMQNTSGEFFGIGVVIDNTRKPKDKTLAVVDTIPGGPSDKAGLKPLDKIVEIEGKPLEGMTTQEATKMLKGKKNTKVSIKVMREGQQDLLTFNIIRDVVKEQNSLSFYIKDHDIFYLSLNMFTQNAIKQVQTLLTKANKKQHKGLILDLRNNSGGLLNAAIDISGLFLDKGSKVVSTKDKNNNILQEYHTNKQPINNHSIPIFILINNYTASAAEILAGVLRAHSEDLVKNQQNKNKLLVFLVGTPTFGKGSVQEVIPVGNNSAIKVTTSLYYLPNDVTIQGTGIEPDFFIDRMLPPTEQMQWFTKNYGREQNLKNSIKPHELTENENKKTDEKKSNETKKDEPTRWVKRAQEMLEKDNQLRETITLVNMLHTFQKRCPDEVCSRTKAIAFLKQNHLSTKHLEIEEVKA